jgi:hypothetical protein
MPPGVWRAFEVINASQVASVGLHPKVRQQLADRIARVRKQYELKEVL